MRSSWDRTRRTGTADNCPNSSVAGGNCGSATISAAYSAEHGSSWLWGSGWDVDACPGFCTSVPISVEHTVVRWSPRYCLQTPTYKNKPQMSFGSGMVCQSFIADWIGEIILQVAAITVRFLTKTDSFFEWTNQALIFKPRSRKLTLNWRRDL